jgi:hypothetical protein
MRIYFKKSRCFMKSIKIAVLCTLMTMSGQGFANTGDNQNLDTVLTIIDDFSTMSSYSKPQLEQYFNSQLEESCESGVYHICYYTPIITNNSKYSFVNKIELRNSDFSQSLILDIDPRFEVKNFDDVLRGQDYELLGNPYPLMNIFYQKTTENYDIGIGVTIKENKEWVIDSLTFFIKKHNKSE